MTTLLESGINIEVINELKNALIEQQKSQIDEIILTFKNEFVSKGYLESEISTDIEIRSYDKNVYLKVILKTQDGVLIYSSTGNICFYEVSMSNIKATNSAIKKIESYYITRHNQEVEEIRKAIHDLTIDTVKFDTYYNEPRVSMKGINYSNSGCYYYYAVNFTNNTIKVTGKELDNINSLISAYKSNIENKMLEEERQKLGFKENMKAWALQNGSELLKARIEENMNWLELAENEYDQSRMPEGFQYKNEDNFDSCWDYKNPTLEHIQSLREARKNEVFTKVELRKCRKTDEDGDKTFYFFVIATMLGYDGIEFEVSKLIDEQFVPAQ